MKPAVTRKWSSFAGFPSRAIANVIAPIIGQAWVAYVPYGRVVGLSKFARVVDAYAERLQIQERMTSEIASAVQEVLQRQGVGVVIKAIHHCLSSRGVQKVGAEMVTSRMHGCFRDSARRGKNSWL
jgi:GTP cyclohydrolase I